MTVARYRPLSDPRWPAPIVWRLAATCATVSIVVYLVAVAIVLAASGRPPEDPLVQLLAAAAAVGAACTTAAIEVRTRVAPLFEVISWSLALTRHRWAGLGFADGVPEPEAGLAALAGRTDEMALAGRASLLAALNRARDLQTLLDGWQPGTPTAAASIARHRVTLDALRGLRTDSAAAYAAAAAIPDPAGGARALAVLHLDAAAREGNAGRSPERELRAARRVLDGAPIDVPVPDGGPNLLVIAATLAVVAAAVPVAVAALLVLGLIGLAAVVATVGAFWLWLRVFLARRRPRVAAGVASR